MNIVQNMTWPWTFKPILDYRTAELITKNDRNDEENNRNPGTTVSTEKHPKKNECNENQDKALLVQIGDDRHKKIEY